MESKKLWEYFTIGFDDLQAVEQLTAFNIPDKPDFCFLTCQKIAEWTTFFVEKWGMFDIIKQK